MSSGIMNQTPRPGWSMVTRQRRYAIVKMSICPQSSVLPHFHCGSLLWNVTRTQSRNISNFGEGLNPTILFGKKMPNYLHWVSTISLFKLAPAQLSRLLFSRKIMAQIFQSKRFSRKTEITAISYSPSHLEWKKLSDFQLSFNESGSEQLHEQFLRYFNK